VGSVTSCGFGVGYYELKPGDSFVFKVDQPHLVRAGIAFQVIEADDPTTVWCDVPERARSFPTPLARNSMSKDEAAFLAVGLGTVLGIVMLVLGIAVGRERTNRPPDSAQASGVG
jgi:hypothetical protein